MANPKFQELLGKLRNLELEQTGYWVDDIPDSIYEEYFADSFAVVANGINPDRHSWYEISTTVVRVQGGLLGIRELSWVSEDMLFSDVDLRYEFFEMREQVTTTFVPV